MAYYNANRVIKLTRKALGITQEKLSEGICEVENYSRIENGHHALRRSTYQKLMEKMGRNVDRRYAICVSKDGMLLDEKIELERAFKRYDYESAEKYLYVLKEKVDDSILSKQYLTRAEALVEYYSGRCSVTELIAKLDEAMKITVPEYERYLEKDCVYPFTKIELLTLMSLGNAYRVCGQQDFGKRIYVRIRGCLKERYIGEPDNMTLRIAVGRNLAKEYVDRRQYKEALQEIDECLELSAVNDYSHKSGVLLVTKAHSYLEAVLEGHAREEKLECASKCLRQAYYLAAARCDDKSAKVIKEYYMRNIEGL